MGRATALTFAREGAAVVGCDVTVEPAEATVEMVHAAGGEMVSLQPCRLNDPIDCSQLVELAMSKFGRIDVLFNLAARSHFSPIETFTDEEWDAARRDEVDLVFFLTRAAWPHLKATGGAVVNMASLNGSLSFKLLPSLAHTTNKAAIIGMTRQLAMEGSAHGIRVNSISPGFIETNATRGELEDEEFGRQMRDRTLLGRFGQARGIAECRAVPRFRRELLRDGHRPRGRWRHEGLVTAAAVQQRRRREYPASTLARAPGLRLATVETARAFGSWRSPF